MRKQIFLTCAIGLILVMVLAGCNAAETSEPNMAAGDTTEAPAETVVEEEVAEAEPTEAPVEEEVAEAEPTEAPVEEEVAEAEPTEAPVEEEVAESDMMPAALAYKSYPPEWLNRNILGNPDATVLVEAYEEFM